MYATWNGNHNGLSSGHSLSISNTLVIPFRVAQLMKVGHMLCWNLGMHYCRVSIGKRWVVLKQHPKSSTRPMSVGKVMRSNETALVSSKRLLVCSIDWLTGDTCCSASRIFKQKSMAQPDAIAFFLARWYHSNSPSCCSLPLLKLYSSSGSMYI